MHEFTGDATFVFDYTFEELKALDVGNGERIPSLQELFELIKKQLYINIEIKSPFDLAYKPKYNH